MTNKLITILSAFLLFSSSAYSQKTYLSVEAGSFLTSGNFEDGIFGGAAFTYRFNELISASIHTHVNHVNWTDSEFDFEHWKDISETNISNTIPTVSFGPELNIEIADDMYLLFSPKVGYAWQTAKSTYYEFETSNTSGFDNYQVTTYQNSKNDQSFYYGFDLGIRFYPKDERIVFGIYTSYDALNLAENLNGIELKPNKYLSDNSKANMLRLTFKIGWTLSKKQ
ncbi:hypothetical protein [Chondrinema litorale]|uniref:hypothetical protein n=1 Tax=Chondrinema litorale TaxID=2994555 RepID=UPI00254336E7|nr:hypothetical protein [Chondrinema litorale]UZR98150.1 hypothetical protein OQ292_29570 [Chondrinema litorale]